MGGSPRGPWRSLLMAAAVGLGLATAPAYAAPAPAPDPSSMVAKVGPTVVDINTQMGYQSAVGAGTGILLDPSGVVLTNNHVISGATNITAVAIGNGQTYDVDVLGYDRSHDVAVVQLRGAVGLPAADLGDSSSVAVGDPVVAMGNAGGQGGTPSAVAGHVSALNQTVSAADELTGSSETLNGMIQADAPIRAGDSGGPMVNAAGQVIGMNTAASDNYKIPQQGGQGFAIPINQALAIAGQIRSGAASNTVHIGDTAFLGVGVVDHNGAGARVERVLANTPAADAGIRMEDVITAVDNAPVTSATALTNLLDQHHPGDTIALTWRGPMAGVHTEKVTLAPGPVG
ncbi:S1C family serine protease [Mycobacterium talmoniae]|uniref:Serine protease n=1 Tax=Mycobacterium talmoniae TaxID=1858794 RepID=A0A1S1NU56_9MYCO|nr:serine protease [Mycobacterium talmoniae]PQM45974.1 Putative serine protease HhoA [Mycobacterium talmoniae]TDH56387.1 PDZ domain-containing protein [Mycobacterium eburneum]